MKIQVLLTVEDIQGIIEDKLVESLPDDMFNPDTIELRCYWKDQNESTYLDLESLQIEAKLETYHIEGDKI